jgi:hypothetical protein
MVIGHTSFTETGGMGVLVGSATDGGQYHVAVHVVIWRRRASYVLGDERAHAQSAEEAG